MKNKKIRTYLHWAPLLFSISCAPTLPLLKNESLKLPEEFPQKEKEESAVAISPDKPWNDFFKDSKLKELIDTAIKNNQELHILEQEINIANNEILARQGEYLPKVSLENQGGIEKRERFSTEDASKRTRFGQFGIQSSWEIDIWKRLRNAAKSAYMRYLGSIEGKRYITTTVVAEVANSYFELMALDNQLIIVKEYINILSQIQEIVSLQLNAARSTALPLKRFAAEVLKNQARQYQLEQKIIITQNKINSLLGRFPQEISRNSDLFSQYEIIPIKSGIPTILLDNRPDIKKAKYDLESAQLNVDVAKKRFYPSLRIDADLGFEAFNSKHFNGTTTSLFYGLAAGLTAPLLNRRAIEADYFSANNKQIQAIYNYELSLIKGYAEVANQLSAIKNLQRSIAAKEKQVSTLKEAVEISNILFKAVRVDYIESLLTQRDALESQLELVEVKKQQLNASVDLYKALGGGWNFAN